MLRWAGSTGARFPDPPSPQSPPSCRSRHRSRHQAVSRRAGSLRQAAAAVVDAVGLEGEVVAGDGALQLGHRRVPGELRDRGVERGRGVPGHDRRLVQADPPLPQRGHRGGQLPGAAGQQHHRTGLAPREARPEHQPVLRRPQPRGLPGPVGQDRDDEVDEPGVRVVQVGGQGRDVVPVLLDLLRAPALLHTLDPYRCSNARTSLVHTKDIVLQANWGAHLKRDANSPGVMPVALRKSRVKCAWSA